MPRGEARSGGRRARRRALRPALDRFPFVATLPQADDRGGARRGRAEPERGAEVTGVDPRVRCRAAGHGRRRRSRGARLADRRARRRVDGRALAYRDGRVPTTTYPDRYLMSDIAVPDRGEADTAIVNLVAGRRARVVPAARIDAPGRGVGCRGRPAVDARVGAGAATASRAARPGRSSRRRCGRDRDRVRRPSCDRAVAAPREAVRHRRRRARGEPDRRPGHESRAAGRGRPRSAARALGARAAAPDAELAAWERRRVRSAVRAGAARRRQHRARPPPPRAADLARRTLVRGMLTPPLGRGFAWAYAMGLDAGAVTGGTGAATAGGIRRRGTEGRCGLVLDRATVLFARRAQRARSGGASAWPVAASCTHSSSDASITSRNTQRPGGRTSASTRPSRPRSPTTPEEDTTPTTP